MYAKTVTPEQMQTTLYGKSRLSWMQGLFGSVTKQKLSV